MFLTSDVRYAVRVLSRSPVFTITAVLSLAIGMAATTAIFNLADALLVRPRTGVTDPATLVDIAVGTTRARRGGGRTGTRRRHERPGQQSIGGSRIDRSVCLRARDRIALGCSARRDVGPGPPCGEDGPDARLAR